MQGKLNINCQTWIQLVVFAWMASSFVSRGTCFGSAFETRRMNSSAVGAMIESASREAKESPASNGSSILSACWWGLRIAIASLIGFYAVWMVSRARPKAKVETASLERLAGSSWSASSPDSTVELVFSQGDWTNALLTVTTAHDSNMWDVRDIHPAGRSYQLTGTCVCSEHGAITTESFRINRTSGNCLVLDARFRDGRSRVPQLHLRRKP